MATATKKQAATITLSCTGTFANCPATASVLAWVPTAGRPGLELTIAADKPCKNGDARPLLLDVRPGTLQVVPHSRRSSASPVTAQCLLLL